MFLRYLTTALRVILLGALLFFAGCGDFFGVHPASLSGVEISDGESYTFPLTAISGTIEKTFTFTNDSDSNLSEIAGSALSAPFSYKGGTFPGTGGTCGDVLNAGASCTIVVSFSPSASGAFNVTLSLSYREPNFSTTTTVDKTLSGSGGTAANLTISDGTIYDFGRVVVANEGTKTFTVTNSGEVSATSVSPGINSPFSLPGGGTCGTTLAGSSTCTLVVKYSPTIFAADSDTLTVSYSNGLTSTSATRSVTATAVGSSGTLDTSFGTYGLATAPVGSSRDRAFGSVQQADGKVIVFGEAYNGLTSSLGLVRFNTDGSLDTSYNSTGKVASNVTAGLDTTAGRLGGLQTDGKLVVISTLNQIYRVHTDGVFDTTFNFSITGVCSAIRGIFVETTGNLIVTGYDNASSADGAFCVSRVLPDGTLDTTFAYDGTFEYEMNAANGIPETAFAAAMHNWGNGMRYVVAGSYEQEFEVVRLYTNGTLDTSFHTDGVLTKAIGTGTRTDCNNLGDWATGVFVDTSGKVVATGTSIYLDTAGTRAPGDTCEGNPAILRVTTSGADDTVTTTADLNLGENSDIRDSTLQTDGKILLTGMYTDASGLKTAIFYRYGTTLTIDNTFGTTGIIRHSFGTGGGSQSEHKAFNAHLQSDGKFIVGAYGWGPKGLDFGLFRINTNGPIDATFQTNGKPVANVNSGDATLTTLQLQTDGKILGIGGTYEGFNFALALIRYETSGALDTSFFTGGWLTRTIGTAAFLKAGVLRSNGNILTITHDTAAAAAGTGYLAAFRSNGMLDTSFRTSGTYTMNAGQTGHTLTEQADGKIIGGGTSNNDFVSFRILTNGILDTSFKTSGSGTQDINTPEGFNRMLETTDGKILGVGYSFKSYVVFRFSSIGVLDTSFHTDGVQSTQISGTTAAFSAFLLADGRLVVAGVSNNSTKSGLVSYRTDGSLDSSFSTDGQMEVSLAYNVGGTAGVLLDTAGRFVGGFNQTAAPYSFGLYRLYSDGSIDTQFGTTGVALSTHAGTSGSARTVLRQTDGRYLLSGTARKIKGHNEFAIQRFWP